MTNLLSKSRGAHLVLTGVLAIQIFSSCSKKNDTTVEPTVIGPKDSITVAITEPLSNAHYYGLSPVTITATATSSNSTISKVEFYEGANIIGSATDAPYTISWTPSAIGTYNLTARAFDAKITDTSASVTAIIHEAKYVPAFGDIYLDSALYPFNGYMGAKNGVSQKIDYKCTDSPHGGKYCISITLDGTEAWVGNVMFAVSPAWQDATGLNFAGFTKMVFWTRCSDATAGDVHMGPKIKSSFFGKWFTWNSTEWRKFEVPLPASAATSPINYLFEYSQTTQPKPGTVIYLDDIQFVK